MVGRSRVILLLTLLTATALSGCTARGEAVTVDGPAWSAGYIWTYEGDNAFAAREQFGDESNDAAGRSTYLATSLVVHTGLASGDEPAYVTVETLDVLESEGDENVFGADRDTDAPFLAAYRQRDLKPLAVEGARVGTCSTSGACADTLQGIAFRDEAPENDFIPFPLQTGDVWRGTQEVGGGIVLAYTAEAGRMQSVETPLGPIDAVRVEVSYRPVNLAQTLRDMEAEARASGFAVEDLDLDFTIDSVYYYSPTYQNLVRGATHFLQRFSATLPDGEGGTVQARSEYRYDERIGLAGARLVPGPERTLEEIGALLRPGTALEDVSGDPVPETTYQVRVDAVTDHVNAFDGEPGRFEARLDGVDTLPPGHALHWRLLDRGGSEVATGNGTVFEPAPAEPGRYTAVLEALDEAGNPLATAGAGLAAHYAGRIDHDCGPANLEIPGLAVAPCPSVPFPVHPGATAFTLVATPSNGTAGTLAELELRDAVGRQVPAEQVGGAWVVDLASMEGTNVGTPAWSADWVTPAGAEEDVRYDVVVQYGDPPTVEVQSSTESTTGLPAGLPAGLPVGLPDGLSAGLPTWLSPTVRSQA